MSIRWLRLRRELVCRKAVELMSAYLDDALGAADRRRLEEHLAECPHCTEYLHQLRAAVELVGRVGPEDLDEAAVEEFVVLYRQWRAG